MRNGSGRCRDRSRERRIERHRLRFARTLAFRRVSRLRGSRSRERPDWSGHEAQLHYVARFSLHPLSSLCRCSDSAAAMVPAVQVMHPHHPGTSWICRRTSSRSTPRARPQVTRPARRAGAARVLRPSSLRGMACWIARRPLSNKPFDLYPRGVSWRVERSSGILETCHEWR
jgi:hypothetical protein